MKYAKISLIWVFIAVVAFDSEPNIIECTGDNTFTGSVDDDWSIAGNWSAGCVPGEGTIIGAITIASDCTLSSTDSADYTFGDESTFVVADGVTFTNNGRGTWALRNVEGSGTYADDLAIVGIIKPGLEGVDCGDGIHPAFADFDSDNFTIYLDGDDVVLETNGLPNHTSPYWSNTNERCLSGPMGNEICTNENNQTDHPLYVAPTLTSFDQMAPGNIDDFNGSYSLSVPTEPLIATSSSSTGLGAIGFAVSGSMIYNDEEGPNVPLDNAVGSLDYTAAHTGPQSYHYHLETKAWSEDDDKLIGIINDGFFIYGRKCNSTGTYPTDLDESGGHVSSTQHCSSAYYHYHIQNELYLNEYYILFPGDYQGTPNNIR